MAALGNFVAGQVLTATELNAIADPTAFTPNWTGVTVGNGTTNGVYYRVNDTIFMQASLVFGSTTSITAAVFLDFPVAANTTYKDGNGGQVTLEDDTGSIYMGPTLRNNTTSFGVRVWNTSGTYLTASVLSSTVPFTWTTNDRIDITHWYQAA